MVLRANVICVVSSCVEATTVAGKGFLALARILAPYSIAMRLCQSGLKSQICNLRIIVFFFFYRIALRIKMKQQLPVIKDQKNRSCLPSLLFAEWLHLFKSFSKMYLVYLFGTWKT